MRARLARTSKRNGSKLNRDSKSPGAGGRPQNGTGWPSTNPLSWIQSTIPAQQVLLPAASPHGAELVAGIASLLSLERQGWRAEGPDADRSSRVRCVPSTAGR